MAEAGVFGTLIIQLEVVVVHRFLFPQRNLRKLRRKIRLFKAHLAVAALVRSQA